MEPTWTPDDDDLGERPDPPWWSSLGTLLGLCGAVVLVVTIAALLA